MKAVFYILVVVIVAAFVVAFIFLKKSPQSSDHPEEVLSQLAQLGLQITDIKVGSGPGAEYGDTLVVHYVGTLESGEKFDSSRDRGQPFEFSLGSQQVIPGWDFGLAGMKVGGVRKLVVPPELAYGDQQRGPIPPNSTLNFEIELLEIKPAQEQ